MLHFHTNVWHTTQLLHTCRCVNIFTYTRMIHTSPPASCRRFEIWSTDKVLVVATNIGPIVCKKLDWLCLLVLKYCIHITCMVRMYKCTHKLHNGTKHVESTLPLNSNQKQLSYSLRKYLYRFEYSILLWTSIVTMKEAILCTHKAGIVHW